ncbi:hypothetical protein B0T25DRAFT_560405 [Lasiosphaeria hispida]|uniref:Uncharacterized protein n=1 Tax=Lasiosphaeria hispida TaxID=260671 RepID=A0AAJ0M7H5_9PEZI|nr:hypothetical protein B0T25DRAFT_560405 [Lasiosphaeria hispida]
MQMQMPMPLRFSTRNGADRQDQEEEKQGHCSSDSDSQEEEEQGLGTNEQQDHGGSSGHRDIPNPPTGGVEHPDGLIRPAATVSDLQAGVNRWAKPYGFAVTRHNGRNKQGHAMIQDDGEEEDYIQQAEEAHGEEEDVSAGHAGNPGGSGGSGAGRWEAEGQTTHAKKQEILARYDYREAIVTGQAQGPACYQAQAQGPIADQ